MAEMFNVHSDVFDAIRSALRRATNEGRSMTIFTPFTDGYLEWFMVGATSKAAGMEEAGAIPCWSVQAHTAEAAEAAQVSAFELETPPEVDRAP